MKTKVTLLLYLSLTFTGYTYGKKVTEPGLTDYVRCAMFHRMMAASFSSRFGSGLESLQIVETEKMQAFVKHSRELAEKDFPDEAKDIFNDEWQFYLKDMFDQINRNYKNVSRLKYRYRERCAKLAENLPD